MSQGSLISSLNEPVDPEDRFAYGWRYVTNVGENGAENVVRVPLTLEDILHPQEEDFRVLSDPHWQDVNYLYDSFKTALANTSGSYVLADCRVAWDADGTYAHGPDVAVIFNVRKKERWSTFNVVTEKTKPSLIVEVTSPSTRSTDLVDKVREYAEVGVLHYVIADAKESKRSREITLIDYQLSPEESEYFSLPPNKEGRVWLPEVNLWLGSEDGQLVCWDENGERVRTVVEERQGRLEEQQAREEAENRAANEQRARKEAEDRAAEAQKQRQILEERVKHLEQLIRNASRSNGTNGSPDK